MLNFVNKRKQKNSDSDRLTQLVFCLYRQIPALSIPFFPVQSKETYFINNPDWCLLCCSDRETVLRVAFAVGSVAFLFESWIGNS